MPKHPVCRRHVAHDIFTRPVPSTRHSLAAARRSLCRSVDKLKCLLDMENTRGNATAQEEKRIALEQLKEEINGVDENSSMKEMLQIDFKFHNTIYRATKNNQVSQILEQSLQKFVRFWLSFPHKIHHQKFFNETLKTIEAIQERDENKVAELSEKHIKVTVDDLVDYFLAGNRHATSAVR